MPIDPRIQAALDRPLRGRPSAPKLRPKQGFAAAPGTGPYKETCGSCRHFAPDDPSSKQWHCHIAGHRPGERRPHGSSPACSRWEARRRG